MASVLPGCGGSVDDEARKASTNSVIAKNDPVRRFLISEQTLKNAPAGSVRRAFLSYWTNLQFEAWDAAARAYDPGLRRFIGEVTLLRALANQHATYRSSRPSIVSTITNGDRAQIRYLRVGAKATVPMSTTWRRDSFGRWFIAYDAQLDVALGDLRALETQQAIDPVSQRMAPAAVRAGNRARRLQSEYLERSNGDRGAARP